MANNMVSSVDTTGQQGKVREGISTPYAAIEPLIAQYAGRVFFLHLESHSSNQCQTLAIAKGLRAENWETHIICRSSCRLAEAAEEHSLSLYRLPDEGGNTVSLLWKFLRILRNQKNAKSTPILVHACDPSASRLVSLAWRLNKKLRIVHTRRLPIMEPDYKAMRRYQVPQAKVISDSLAGKIALRLSGLEPHLLHTIACGIDLGGYPTRKDRKDGRFVYGMTGELMPARGHSEIFAVVPQLEKVTTLPSWEVRILGEGPHFTNLLEEAKVKNVDSRLTFLSGLDSATELCNCDALILPASDGESYLPRILEGWAANIPIVTINRLDHAEILQDGANCLLVQPGHMEGLVEQMVRIATDPGLHERLVEGGRIALHKFSLLTMVAEHRRLYREILA